MDDKNALAKIKPVNKPPDRPEDQPGFKWKETPLGQAKTGISRELELDYKTGKVTDPLHEPASVTLGVEETHIDFQPNLDDDGDDEPTAEEVAEVQTDAEGAMETWQLTDHVGQIEAILEAPRGHIPSDLVRARLQDVQDITEVAPGVCTVRLTTGKFKRLRLCQHGGDKA